VGMPQKIIRRAVARDVKAVRVMGDKNRYWRSIEEGRQFRGSLTLALFALPQFLLCLLTTGDVEGNPDMRMGLRRSSKNVLPLL